MIRQDYENKGKPPFIYNTTPRGPFTSFLPIQTYITYTSREIDHQRDEKREYKSYGSLVWEGLGFE